MKANETKVEDFLSSNKTQFVIPVYQRNYDWSTGQCKQLLDDILEDGRSWLRGEVRECCGSNLFQRCKSRCSSQPFQLSLSLRSTLNSKIWPVSTYSMLMFSLPCGILASSYPSLTLFSGVVARVVLYVLLLTSSSVFSVQVVEVLYGLFVVVDGLVLVR